MRDLRLKFEDVCIPLWIGSDCIEEIIAKVCDLEASSYHVVTDKTVAQLHGRALFERLRTRAPARLWIVEDGESTKCIGTVARLAQEMVGAAIDRRSAIVAVGGGVVGNLSGLTAALLFRGIRLVHIPTTLIAAADSVASLKQAVNLPQGKNLLGCFHRPAAVLIDLAFLQTLPAAQIRSGMNEIVKNALTVATESIPLLESRLNSSARYSPEELMAIVEAGVLAKQRVMAGDMHERRQGLIFEYGHTVGHAIELAAAGGVSHGEAVGLGMVVAADVSNQLGLLSESGVEVHVRLLRRNGLVMRLPPNVTVPAVMSRLLTDNKRGYVPAQPEQVPMILLEGLGMPHGPADRPLTPVDTTLIQSCIKARLAGAATVAIKQRAL